MRYDVVLIQPAGGVLGSIIKPRMPMGLLCVASLLAAQGKSVKILDQALSKDWEQELSRALEEEPLCVGVTAMTGLQITWGLKASALVKKKSRAPVVWGGPHPTILPEVTVHHPLVDIVVMGEGEETFSRLVTCLEQGGPLSGVAGVCYKESGAVRANPRPDFLDLNSLPMLPYEMVPLEDYLYRDYYGDRVIEIESSRGCPFQCSHCYNLLVNRRRWRAKSAARVLEEIRFLHEKYRVLGFEFTDDSFFVDKKRVLDICEGIISQGLDVSLSFQGADIRLINRFSDQELRTMERAGVRKLRFGLESGSPRILKLMNRPNDISEVLALNQRLKRFPRMVPAYNVMCGYPTETEEDLFLTVSLVSRLLSEAPDAYISTFMAFKSWPGTPISETARAEGFPHPQTLEEWGGFGWNDLVYERVDPRLKRLFSKAMFCSFFVDDKIQKTADCGALKKSIGHAYGPVARWRFRHCFFSLMPEERVFSLYTRLYGKLVYPFQEKGQGG